MTNIIDKSLDTKYKLWYCIETKCSSYKVKMTIEDHMDHMIKFHKMKPPSQPHSAPDSETNKNCE